MLQKKFLRLRFGNFIEISVTIFKMIQKYNCQTVINIFCTNNIQMASIFSGFCYLGLRDYLLDAYAFNPPLPSYTLRIPKKRRTQSLDHKNSDIIQNLAVDEGNNRLHIVSSTMRVGGSQSIEHIRITLRQSIAASFSQARKTSIESKIRRDESFQEKCNFEESLQNQLRSKSQFDLYNLALRRKIIIEEEEDHSQNQITPSQQESGECNQQFSFLLVDKEECLVYELPELEKLEVIGYYLTTSSLQKVAGVYINYLEQRCERVILYSHGNSCDLGYSLDTLFDLAYNLKINVFAYEYSGYGQSSGKKSDIEIIKCIQAAYHFLIRKGFKWHQIILYGYSIGSGPTVTLASLQEYPVRGIILHSPIASGLRTVFGPLQKTSFYDIFPNVDLIEYIRAPILLMHGLQDDVVPYGSSIQLKNKIKKLFHFWSVDGGNHFNIDIQNDLRQTYFKNIRDFTEALSSSFVDKTEVLPYSWNQFTFNHLYFQYFKSQNDVLISTKNSDHNSYQKEIQMRDSRQQLQSSDSNLIKQFYE